MARNALAEIVAKELGARAGFPIGLGLLETGLFPSTAKT